MTRYDLDYDLRACLEYNPQDGFTDEDIVSVLAVWEGENDGDDWRWVLSLTEDRFVFLQGGCDYTGWDCQSWATSAFRETAEEAAQCALGDIPVGTLLEPKGIGKMLSMLTGDYMGNAKEVYESLLRQLSDGKKTTWREEKDAELGVQS